MKIRILSAIVALAIIIPLLWFGGCPFAIAIGILSVLAYKEILGLKKSHKEIPNIVKILGLISVVYIVIGNYGNDTLEMINYPKILFPLIFLLLPTVFYKKDKYTTQDAFYLLGTVYLIGLIFNLIIIIENLDVKILLYLLSVSFITDTFAYLTGRLIGKHKMSPKISPSKTWEGAIAGLIGGVVISMIVYVNLLAPFSINTLILTIILSIVGQIGDLVYSKIKRENEIKDFSNIIPGHGGILDRLDSLSFIIFAFAILRIFL